MSAKLSLSSSGVAPGTAHPLFRWYRNYAKRLVRLCNVLLIGDSIAWGAGVPMGGTPNRDGHFDTMSMQLQNFLNQVPWSGPKTTETGYPAAAANTVATTGYPVRLAHMAAGAGTPNPWRTISGTTTGLARGIGLRSVQLNAGSRIAYTAPSAAGFHWWFENGASNLGTPAITIYAGEYSATRTGVYVANFAQAMNTGLAQYTRSVDGALLPARGKWTIEFSPSTGTPVLDMIYVVNNDYNQGVRVFNYAWTGTNTVQWAANTTEANTAANSIASIFGEIDLIILYLGANDYAVQTTSPATFQTALGDLIDKYRAVQTRVPAVLIVSHFARYDTTPTSYPWVDFQAAMRAVAAAKAETAYLDLAPFFPVSQAADTDGDLVDSTGVHLPAAGQALAAQLIAQKLTAPYAI